MTFTEIANAGIRHLQPYQPGKPRDEVARELGLHQIDKLASNENMLGPSPKALAAIQSVLADCHYYPDAGAYELRKALANKYHIEPERIILGNGSDNILSLIVRCFAKPNDEILYSEYGFATYAIIAKAHHAIPRAIKSRDYCHDLRAMAKAVTDKTAVIFIANPNNPTGTFNTHHEVRELLDTVPTNVLVVLDEAYYEYMQESDYADSLSLQAEFPNLITTRTFSKAYGLAGLRVGYGICHPEICDLLNRVRLPFNVNSVAQAAAIAALEDATHLQNSLRMNQQGRQQLLAGLADLEINSIPSVANFITIDVGQAAQPIYQALLQAGIIVRPLLPYNMPNHLRITIGTAAQNQRLLQALAVCLQTATN